MFVVPYAAKFFGPFETADEAAKWADRLEGPWTVAKLIEPHELAQSNGVPPSPRPDPSVPFKRN